MPAAIAARVQLNAVTQSTEVLTGQLTDLDALLHSLAQYVALISAAYTVHVKSMVSCLINQLIKG